MQRNALAEKKKIFWDGVEIQGLVSVGEVLMEKSTIEVPSFHRIRTIQSGITKLPILEIVYRIDRDSNTQKFWQDYYTNDENHDAVFIRTDAGGNEFARRILPSCECLSISEPAYDAASPTYAKITVKICPWDILFVDAE